MAQIPFTPTANVTTHSDATTHFNTNFQDAEDRLSSLESVTTQQTISSSSGTTTLNVSSGKNASLLMSEDTNLVISNASAGDSGVIVVRQDSTGSWQMTTSHTVLTGTLSNISSITANSLGVCSITWYYDGSEYLIYISQST